MGKVGRTYILFVGNPPGKCRRGKIDVKMNHKETGCDVIRWMEVTCSVAGFGISDVETSDSAAAVLVAMTIFRSN
jgi:hypothetical protein